MDAVRPGRAAGATCTGLLDTFQYTLIGYEPDVQTHAVVAPLLPVPDSTDTATISVVSGTALRTPGAANDVASAESGVAVSGNLLANDCDQTNTTPASAENVTASSTATVPNHGYCGRGATGVA